MSKIKLGIYRHFKGAEYEVLGIAKNSETNEHLVIYRPEKDHKIWARPLKIFAENVEKDGAKVPRFEYLRDSQEKSWEEKYKRALADTQNILKQCEKDRAEFAKYTNESIIRDVLPIYENLKISIISLDDEQSANPWVEGIKYVIKQFQKFLSDHNVQEIRAEGQVFDPSTMDAIEGEGEIVGSVIRTGYTLNGKVISATRVVLEKEK